MTLTPQRCSGPAVKAQIALGMRCNESKPVSSEKVFSERKQQFATRQSAGTNQRGHVPQTQLKLNSGPTLTACKPNLNKTFRERRSRLSVGGARDAVRRGAYGADCCPVELGPKTGTSDSHPARMITAEERRIAEPGESSLHRNHALRRGAVLCRRERRRAV